MRGYDIVDQPVVEKRMIGHSRVLSGRYRDPTGARIVGRALLLKAGSRLRRYGLYTGALHFTVKLPDGGALSHEARFRPTQNSWRLLDEFDDFWSPMVTALKRRHGHDVRIKALSTYLHELSTDPPERDLFVPQKLDEEDARQTRLWTVIDDLNRRYGAQTVGLQGQKGLDLNYLGVKIAFSRVPDREEFDEGPGTGEDVVSRTQATKIAPSRALY